MEVNIMANDPSKKVNEVLSSLDPKQLQKGISKITKLSNSQEGEKLKKQLENIDTKHLLQMFNNLDANEIKQKLNNLDINNININDIMKKAKEL